MVTTEISPALALEPKTKLTGKVLKTTLAGALVDVGQPVPGVLHISQLRKEPVNRVEDVVKEGQTVEVWVRKVRKDRIELTMIEPLQYEWKDLKPEMLVRGKVVRVEPYGAFVDIGAERPAMLHVSEMAHGRVKQANRIVKEGDEIEARVLSVDRKKRQIRLSTKALPAGIPDSTEGKKHKREKKNLAAESAVDERHLEPELTAMQIAWQEALERSKKEKEQRLKPIKAPSAEQEEILNRTLEKRLPTSA